MDLINLPRASPVEQGKLGSAVSHQGGVITLLVHPFYMESDPLPFLNPSTTYKLARDEEISSLARTGKPLLILEEESMLSWLKTTLQGFPRGTAYVIPTYRGNPEPFLPELTSSEDAWGYLKELLRTIGAVHATLGGRDLRIGKLSTRSGDNDEEHRDKLHRLLEESSNLPNARAWLKSHLLPYSCVGITAQKLVARGIDVSFLSATFPEVMPKLDKSLFGKSANISDLTTDGRHSDNVKT